MFAAAIFYLPNVYTQKATKDVLHGIPNPYHNQPFANNSGPGIRTQKILLSQFTTKFMNSLRQTPMPLG